jgi:hypothetical protein
VGSELSIGSRIMVGQNGSAVIRIGAGCRVEVPGGSDVSVSLEDGNLCVRLIDPMATAQTQGAGGSAFGGPGAIFGGMVVGGAAGVAVDGGSDPISN